MILAVGVIIFLSFLLLYFYEYGRRVYEKEVHQCTNCNNRERLKEK